MPEYSIFRGGVDRKVTWSVPKQDGGALSACVEIFVSLDLVRSTPICPFLFVLGGCSGICLLNQVRPKTDLLSTYVLVENDLFNCHYCRLIVWTQIRPDKMWGLIWTQIVYWTLIRPNKMSGLIRIKTIWHILWWKFMIFFFEKIRRQKKC